MIQTNNAPAETRKDGISTSNTIQQTVAQILSNNANSTNYGNCRCGDPAINLLGVCARHL